VTSFVHTLDLYLGGVQFESQLGHWLSWLRFSWFSRPLQVNVKYLDLGHDCFLRDDCLLITLPCNTIPSELLTCHKINGKGNCRLAELLYLSTQLLPYCNISLQRLEGINILLCMISAPFHTIQFVISLSDSFNFPEQFYTLKKRRVL
jgi:hypothetical protein